MRFIILGDTHIPDRTERLPEWVEKVVEGKKYDEILFTGDATEYSILHYLERYAKTYAVRGNMDFLDLPRFQIIDVLGHRIFLFHSTEVRPRGDPDQLWEYGKTAGADIVVFGHTHKREVYAYKGLLFINPGTATGAWGGATSGEPESLAILELGESKATVLMMKNGKPEFLAHYKHGEGWKDA
ncbi:MAG: metallophosphoesterase [Candidatus Diapherotrites archaeon]|nr:metallophosphoesterase [Candidatus Diapherotrites archaeon]